MWLSALIAAFTVASGVEYQSDTVKAMQADSFGNPGLLWVDRGAGCGIKCIGCHGDIELKGVAARYPRQSPQLGRVVDLEQRIQACMPGLPWESRDLLGLTALVARQSNAIPISVDVSGPAASTHERGRSLYFERQGQLNLACTHCHDANVGKTLLSEPISQGQPADWPAYRLEWQSLGSLQRRLRACYFGVRAEMPAFGSDDLVALELYLAARGQGLAASVPGVRR